MFVSEFTTLEFSGVVESLTFIIKSGDKELFNNLYYPDSSGALTIYDLDTLLELYIDEIYIDITLYANGNIIGPDIISVFTCSASVEDTAQTFVKDFFLSSMMNERDTCMGRYETLTAFCPEEEDVKALCSYRLPDGSIETSEVGITSLLGWSPINVSPDRFYRADAQLIGYVVSCGKRTQRYRVLAYAPPADPVFMFRNAFHAWETFYFTGKKEIEPTYTRSHATVAGRFRNYHVEEVVKYKVYTGPLRQGMEAVAFDIARSEEVFLLNKNGIETEEITILDCDLKYSNEDKEIPNLSFTYRLADRRNARIAVVHPPNIFDKTFDESFN